MYQLSEKKKRKGWKEHVPGTPMPVGKHTEVKVCMRGGYKHKGAAHHFEWCAAEDSNHICSEDEEIVAYKVIKPKPTLKERGKGIFPPKKHYKLSDMWKVWYLYKLQEDASSLKYHLAKNKEVALKIALRVPSHSNVLAITPATQDHFYEGEGLDVN